MFVDKLGFEQIDSLILQEKDKLKAAVRQKAEAYQNDTNSWHDNAAYDAALEKENESIEEINRLIDIKMSAEIVEKHNIKDAVDLDDIVEVVMDDDDVFEVTLTGKFLADSKNGEVTLNSPLGKCIYKKCVGDKLSYTAHSNHKCNIEILSIKKQ